MMRTHVIRSIVFGAVLATAPAASAAGAPSGDLICKGADWLGDEPATCEPHDCQPSGEVCLPE